MTREEAISVLKLIHTEENGIIREPLNMAIKALEQKPETVTEFADRCRECGARYGRLLKQTRWIPVSERLPENAKHKGAFCPKYYVMTEFGQTEGWYNPDVGCWYVLLWFMDARFETWNISLERGDVPKLVKNVPVIAWMPLPEPYKADMESGE